MSRKAARLLPPGLPNRNDPSQPARRRGRSRADDAAAATRRLPEPESQAVVHPEETKKPRPAAWIEAGQGGLPAVQPVSRGGSGDGSPQPQPQQHVPEVPPSVDGRGAAAGDAVGTWFQGIRARNIPSIQLSITPV